MQSKHGFALIWTHGAVVSILILAAFGCRDLNREYYCPAHPEDPDCPPIAGPCETSDQCLAPTPVCNAETMTCVECVETKDCASSRPICNTQNTCVECERDVDCQSDLCLPNGTCADPTDVAHVGGPNAVDSSECSVGMPCKTLQQALTPFRKYIKATGMITNAGVTTIDRKTVSIFGEPGMTTITRSGGSADPVLDIRNESVVNLVDLEIVGGQDGNAVDIRDAPGPMVSMTRVQVRGGTKLNGIQVAAGKLVLADSQVSNCAAAGINIIGGSLVVTGSQVRDNAQEGVKAGIGTQVEIRRSSTTGNRGMAGVYAVDAGMVVIDSSTITSNVGIYGGISIKGFLSITNTIIASNGLTASSVIGGVYLDSSNARFEFNTVADNNGQQGGMACGPTVIDVSDSIFVGNTFAGIACNVTYSLTGATLAGTGNKTGDPAFLSKSLTNPMFYRIGSASAAKDSADPNATLDIDIDGQPRTGLRDMGADEAN